MYKYNHIIHVVSQINMVDLIFLNISENFLLILIFSSNRLEKTMFKKTFLSICCAY